MTNSVSSFDKREEWVKEGSDTNQLVVLATGKSDFIQVVKLLAMVAEADMLMVSTSITAAAFVTDDIDVTVAVVSSSLLLLYFRLELSFAIPCSKTMPAAHFHESYEQVVVFDSDRGALAFSLIQQSCHQVHSCSIL